MTKKLNIVICCLLFAFIAQAQTRKITGTVISADDGEPIIGASVSVKGTSFGTATNFEGVFSLDVPSDAKSITVSYLGMETQQVEIGNQSVFKITLSEDVNELDEVMVVAYGVANRGSFTGSAAKITSSAMENRPITNLTQALSGAAPGVQVGNNSGQPGTGPSLRIRGISSINGDDANTPLYVVDGSPYENALSSINPEDIESITILKDASSAALYGARAAAGVVIITTKSGKKGKPTFNIKATQSFTHVGMEFYDLIGPEDFYVINWEKLRNQYGISQGVPMDIAAKLASGIQSEYQAPGKNPAHYDSVYDALRYNPFNVANNAIVGEDGKFNPNAQFMWGDDMDWVNSVRQLGLREEYTMSYSGANDKTDYFASAGYLNERGYMKQSYFNRMSVRANINSRANNWLKVGLNMNGNISDGMNPSAGSPYYYPLYMAPIYPLHVHDQATGDYVLSSTGEKLYDFGGGMWGQPIRPINSSHNIAAELPEYQDKFRRSLMSGKTYAEITFLKDFTFTTNYSADLNTYYSTDYTAKMEGIASPGRLTKQTSQRLTWNFNQLLKYQKSFGSHNVDLLAGHEAFSTSIFDMSGERSQQMSAGIIELNNFSELNSLGSYTRDYRTEGYIFRGNYDYEGKYIGSFSYRRDASSKFYADTRWGGFWSIGLAWRLDKESFIKSIDFIDLFKLRGSYGQVGNDSGVGYYAWQSLYSLRPNAGVPGYAMTSLGNRGLQWESNNNFDAALEFGFLKRYSGSVEFFNKESKNMLYDKPLNPSSGFSQISENAFSMYNRGIEVELAADLLRNRNGFNWTLRANATHYENKITNMPVEPYRNGTKKIEVGHSIYDFSLKHFIGVNPETGLSMYTPDPTLNPDVLANLPTYNDKPYTTDINQAGYEYGPSAIPKVYGGISTTLSYKDLALTIQTSYQFGGKIYDSNYRTLMTWSSTTFGSNFHKDILNRWQNPGDITNVPRMDATDKVATDQAGANSDRWLVSSNYFELTSMNLSYSLPKKFTDRLGLKKLTIYGTGDMLYRYTAKKGLNVRYSYNGTVGDGYLPATTYTLGLNLSF
ncbi:SusC/RagA family TonB-linked outer membrane protein [Bacteroidia bacterium]|nr:SusC/RagA family TonB-linked outer membrane protein [Bacteroidia bacterium]GHT27103.1 SusC/RagA family TonB-linked outer membrane protein [Bacteroidia bacterium]GHV71144.1 SusC/RagA family TonB-linked outer membrane protein [Bacteroidia bacterium]